MPNVTGMAGPAKGANPSALLTKKRAELWGAVWEATQVMNFDQIRALVEGTLREVEVDHA